MTRGPASAAGSRHFESPEPQGFGARSYPSTKTTAKGGGNEAENPDQEGVSDRSSAEVPGGGNWIVPLHPDKQVVFIGAWFNGSRFLVLGSTVGGF